MKVGTLASLGLWIILIVLALGVGMAMTYFSGRFNYAPQTSLLIGCTVLAVLFASILIPLGMMLDKSMVHLQRMIQSAADNDHPTSYAGPRLLAPVLHAFTVVIDQFRQQEVALHNQIRDLEIRHRVSEVERKQIEAVLHSLRDGVIVTDIFDEVVMANDCAAEALGFQLEDAIHANIEKLVSDERFHRLIRDAREVANFADSRHVELELPSPNNDGTSVMYEVTLACVENHKHEVGGVVTILHDLTREREVSQMKSDFVSKASHELRTPLASIRAYVEMLVDGEAEDEHSRQEFYRIMQDETERLGRLIDNMLNISRIEAGIIQIEREIVDIKQLVERAINTLEPSAREKQISLHSRLASIDLTVEGDEDMLYQVVLNLISNAVKYTPEGGRVNISADSNNLTRSVVVGISDTGLGIPPDSIPKLFDKFYRVENYKRIAKGTGLGLSLCKHIVETVHRGQIGVESKLGMGSKFWFSVPMRYVGSQAAA